MTAITTPDPPKKIIAVVELSQLLVFVKLHLRVRTLWGGIFWLLALVPTAGFVYACFHWDIPFKKLLDRFVFGIALLFVLLPIHELIHAAAYKLFGAPRVSFGGDLKKGIIYAAADKFVINRPKFLVVALAPFVLITGALIAAISMSPFPTFFIYWTALLFHTGGCYGDFALVSFMHEHPSKNILTMDDVKEGKTYFFEHV